MTLLQVTGFNSRASFSCQSGELRVAYELTQTQDSDGESSAENSENSVGVGGDDDFGSGDISSRRGRGFGV